MNFIPRCATLCLPANRSTPELARYAAAMNLLLTCEHGGNGIPARYAPLFRAHERLLRSHRGYDIGAVAYARDFARAFGAPLVYSTTSRLLVELNRSPHHPNLFSRVTRRLPSEERERILQRYYRPYRSAVEAHVASAAGDGERVLHISCHSFAPRMSGVRRNAEIGLLYDPAREQEARFCRAWQRTIERLEPGWRVRRNYPYRGSDDGLTTYLRSRFGAGVYCGIEIEVNQKFPLGDARIWHAARRTLLASLRETIAAEPP
jgi:predicted N-formylglutamate amidohydrolase